MKYDLTARSIGVAVLCIAPLLHGCGPMVVAGAAYGASVAYERRSTQMVFDDEMVELQARKLLFQNRDISAHSSISVTSYNLMVLLTGQARSAEVSEKFAKLVSELPKVVRVYNEVQIGPNISFARESNDAYLTSRAKLALQDIDLPGFDMLRVKIVTEDGVVYLMGLVTPQEADATVDKVRRIPGVVRVVKLFEYVQPKSKDQAPAS